MEKNGIVRQAGDVSSVHRSADVDSGVKIDSSSRIGAYSRISGEVSIDKDCVISDNVSLEGTVSIGERVTVQSGVRIVGTVVLSSDVFIAANAVMITSVLAIGTKPKSPLPIVVQNGAVIGANATILDGVTIGREAFVSAGSVVTKDVPPNAVVAGNPAQIETYVDTHYATRGSRPRDSEDSHDEATPSRVRGVRVCRLPLFADLRGNLSVAEFARDLPFLPRRYFVTFGVPSKQVRGEHAHRSQHQFLVCVHGACAVVVDDGKNREEILLDEPNLAIYVPPLVWATEYKHTADSVLLVLASAEYDPSDYIRDYDAYLAVVRDSAT